LPAPLNWLLAKTIAFESKLLSFTSFPIGVDLFIAARKK